MLATDIRFDALEQSAKDLAWDPQRVRLRRLDVRDAGEWRAAVAAVVDAGEDSTSA